MSELLEKARSYEAKKIAATDKESKPLFHISAPAGWINDPNGFSVYNGKIHLFYQEGYQTAEIAEILGRKESTVRSDLKRARERLKIILKEEYDFG